MKILKALKFAFHATYTLAFFFCVYLIVSDSYRSEQYMILVPATNELCIVNIDGRTQAMHCRPASQEREADADAEQEKSI